MRTATMKKDPAPPKRLGAKMSLLLIGLVGVSCLVGLLVGTQTGAVANYRINLGDGRTVLVKCQQPVINTVDGKTIVRAGNQDWEAVGPVQIEMLLAGD